MIVTGGVAVSTNTRERLVTVLSEFAISGGIASDAGSCALSTLASSPV